MPELPPAMQRLVLVIDDEDLIRSLLERLLEFVGFEAVTAPDGLTGLKLFEQHGESICVVFLDLTMPGMDGTKTLSAIRLLNPDVRVVVMTGHGEGAAEDLLRDDPNTRFLAKPFTLSVVASCLAEMLSESPATATC